MLITADGGYRRGEVFPLKPAADEALADTPTIEHVVVVRRGGNDVEMVDGRDHWYHDLIAAADAVARPSRWTREQLLFLLYTSRHHGQAEGHHAHDAAATSPRSRFTHKYVFDLHPDTDVYWCTADVGWVTGHSYIVYGPLANGATSVMYEGVPNFPGNDRFWAIIEKYKVTKFYTAPTAIRTFMKWGAEEPAKHDLSSLRVLGSVGEPINPEAWMWYHEHIGGGTLPGRRHVVADRDRRDHDQPAARRHHHQAGLGDVPAARHRRRGRRRRRRARRARRRLPHADPAVAGRCCAASGATRALPRDVLEPLTRAATSPATAPSSTTTATSGCSAGSTT